MVTPRYLLDTNVLSEPLKPEPNPSVIAQLHRHRHEMTTATIVWHELWFGCYRLPMSRKRQRIEQYLNEVVLPFIPILPYNQAAAEWHAEERSRLVSIGQPPPFVDGQIAAVAHAHDMIVVTRNEDDFQRFTGITVENWFLPDLLQKGHNGETHEGFELRFGHLHSSPCQ
jgi:tRNA(fMet)-specific endonuclease VapC